MTATDLDQPMRSVAGRSDQIPELLNSRLKKLAPRQDTPLEVLLPLAV